MRRVLHALNAWLHDELAADPGLFVLGEDILDPYGGAFKVTRGLSERFGERVRTTPISEAGIVGVGAGLALGGQRAIVEIMFGDFVTLIVDQLVNQASKMTWMYGEPVPFHLVVRTPMGGRRGYGPTHSQTLDRLFCGVPGLSVVAVSHVVDPAVVGAAALRLGHPVLLVENKLLYQAPVLDAAAVLAKHELLASSTSSPLPTVTLSPREAPDVTVVTYGGMAPLALEAADRLREQEGLLCELVVPHCISPLDIDPLRASVRRTRRLVVVEEGVGPFGWGAEVITRLSTVALEAPPQRVAASLSPIPASRAAEAQVLPQVADIVDAAVRTVDEVLE